MKGPQEGTVNLGALRGQIKRASSPYDSIQYDPGAGAHTNRHTSGASALFWVPLHEVELRGAVKLVREFV